MRDSLHVHSGRRGRSGQTLLEFALLVPVLLLLVLGAIDAGRAVSVDIALNNVAREAARYSILNSASLNPCSTVSGSASGAPDCATILNAALRVTPLVTRASVKDITMTYQLVGADDGSGGTQRALVTMHYTFQPITGFLLGGATIPFSANATYLAQ